MPFSPPEELFGEQGIIVLIVIAVVLFGSTQIPKLDEPKTEAKAAATLNQAAPAPVEAPAAAPAPVAAPAATPPAADGTADTAS